MSARSAWVQPSISGYRHEALFYAGQDEFLESTATFIRDGITAGEPTLVMVGAKKIGLLRTTLGRNAGNVEFADMTDVGVNPARIIPAWRDFMNSHAGDGHGLRGIGEPIYPERSSAELAECHRHEALLNVAFDDSVPFFLLCPYDTTALDPAVIADAEHNHPLLIRRQTEEQSATYLGYQAATAPFTAPLPEAPADAVPLSFGSTTLTMLRGFVSRRAARAGFRPAEIADLVFAVNEVATNSVRHGGGRGILRLWEEDDGALVCEIGDGGRLTHPLVGRERPRSEAAGGRGLWLVNQLCDLVQVRSFPSGAVVRLRMRRR
jgi:anti-sigma regulatory factor (Ser/Thr protein kinase)